MMTDLKITFSVKLLCLISADGHFSMVSPLICPEIYFVRYLGLNPQDKSFEVRFSIKDVHVRFTSRVIPDTYSWFP